MKLKGSLTLDQAAIGELLCVGIIDKLLLATLPNAIKVVSVKPEAASALSFIVEFTMDHED